MATAPAARPILDFFKNERLSMVCLLFWWFKRTAWVTWNRNYFACSFADSFIESMMALLTASSASLPGALSIPGGFDGLP